MVFFSILSTVLKTEINLLNYCFIARSRMNKSIHYYGMFKGLTEFFPYAFFNSHSNSISSCFSFSGMISRLKRNPNLAKSFCEGKLS